MHAWIVDRPGPIATGPLRRIERAEPLPGPRQVRVRVSCCGVCRTDLHLAEGDLPPRRHGVTPGHEIVGRVDALGAGAHRFAPGQRIGIPWLGGTDGTCRYSVGAATDTPPEPLDGAILFAPAGELVPLALRALDRGGTLAIAGIWLSDIPALNYERELFQERRLRSVTANTRADADAFLTLAARFGVRATTTAYPMADADRALRDLAAGAFSGAAVLHN